MNFLDQKGFSIVEVVFFLVILSLALVTFSMTWVPFVKTSPQFFEQDQMLDLAYSCATRIKFRKTIKLPVDSPDICLDLVKHGYQLNLEGDKINGQRIKVQKKDGTGEVESLVLEVF